MANDAIFCESCIKHGMFEFEYARSCVKFNDTAKKLIYNLKYGDAKFLAEPLGNYLYETACDNRMQFDVVVSVPLHKKRQQVRGYNQSEILAKSFTKHAGKPYVHALNKLTHAKNLATLSRQERQKTITGSFGLRKEAHTMIKDKNVLLIDDVLTTAATANECARILKKEGKANSVKVLTFTSVSLENSKH